MFGRTKHARILMHRRNAAAYVDGRYLHVDAKLSIRSRRDREIARELATTILNEVMASEPARDLANQVQDNAAMASRPGNVANIDGDD